MNEQFLGYDIKELLKTMFHVKCPQCGKSIFELFISDNGFIVPVCYQCRYIPTVEELIGIKEGKGKG